MGSVPTVVVLRGVLSSNSSSLTLIGPSISIVYGDTFNSSNQKQARVMMTRRMLSRIACEKGTQQACSRCFGTTDRICRTTSKWAVQKHKSRLFSNRSRGAFMSYADASRTSVIISPQFFYYYILLLRYESYFLDVGLQYFPSAVYKVQMTKSKLTFLSW